jgi:hypothetical protein
MSFRRYPDSRLYSGMILPDYEDFVDCRSSRIRGDFVPVVPL